MHYDDLRHHYRGHIKLFLLDQHVHPAQKRQRSMDSLLLGLICVHSRRAYLFNYFIIDTSGSIIQNGMSRDKGAISFLMAFYTAALLM